MPVIEEASPVERVIWGMERARRSSWAVFGGEGIVMVGGR